MPTSVPLFLGAPMVHFAGTHRVGLAALELLLPESTESQEGPIPVVRTWSLTLPPRGGATMRLVTQTRVPQTGHVTGLEDLHLPECPRPAGFGPANEGAAPFGALRSVNVMGSFPGGRPQNDEDGWKAVQSLVALIAGATSAKAAESTFTTRRG